MIQIRNFVHDNDNIQILEKKGVFTVFQHNKDMSVTPGTAATAYYMAKSNCTVKQVLIELQNNAIRLKPGAMQFMTGNVQQSSGVTGVGDMMGKMFKSKLTGDAPVKPLYQGTGIVVCEPTYYYPIIEDVSEWNGLCCDDGMFLCCDDEVRDEVQMRTNITSAVAGGEGLFNLRLAGQGYAVLQSRCPREELYEIILENDSITIDGNMAVCWSASLQFSTERSSKSLLGSATSGEGFVNVYRGTGKILMAPHGKEQTAVKTLAALVK